MIDYTTAMRIRAKLAAGQVPKAIAYDEGVGIGVVYRVKNNQSYVLDKMHEREIERIRRVTKALEENPNASINKLVKASRVSFGNLKRIMNEYRKR